MDKLEKMSYEDQLTDVFNRNYLNDFLEKNMTFENTGIVFGDLLGLKHINDTLGHHEGDELLIRASNCLKSTFRKNDIFRIGGDEFLIISKGIEEVFEKRISDLRDKMSSNNVKMSLGVIWKPIINDIKSAITEADALMYEEKRAYYASKKDENNDF